MEQSPQKRNIQASLDNVRSIMVDTVALQQQVDEMTGIDTLRSSKRLSPRKRPSPKLSPAPSSPEESSESHVEESPKTETTSLLVARRFKLKPGTPKLKPRPTRRPVESPKSHVSQERSPAQLAILQLLEKQRLSPSQARLQRNAMRPSPSKNRTLREQEAKSRLFQKQPKQALTPTKDFSSVSSGSGEASPKRDQVIQESKTAAHESDMSIEELSSDEHEKASPRSQSKEKHSNEAPQPEEEEKHSSDASQRKEEKQSSDAPQPEEEESVHEPEKNKALANSDGSEVPEKQSSHSEEEVQPQAESSEKHESDVNIEALASDSNKGEPEAPGSPNTTGENTFVSDKTNSDEEAKGSEVEFNIDSDDAAKSPQKEAAKSDDIDIDLDLSD